MTPTWNIPIAVIRETEEAFRRGAHEVFVLWCAPRERASHLTPVTRCIVPAQTPGLEPDGIYVHIDGVELAKIQLANFAKNEETVIQLHTHPGSDVRMSQLDRDWEVVAWPGALSIIVPKFGTTGMAGFKGVNVYEREIEDWRLWTHEEAISRLHIV